MAEGNSEGGMTSFLMSMVPGLISSGVTAATQGGPRRQYKWNQRAAEEQNRRNRENAEWIMEQNKKLQEEQRLYDSPAAQRQRFIEAGLNPHMMYGGGASGGSAFPFQAPSMPGYNMGQVDASYPDVAGSFIGAQQAAASMQLARARTNVAEQDAALRSVQVEIAKNNPMLDSRVAQWVSNAMLDTARLKSLESQTWAALDGEGRRRVSARIDAEINALVQKLGLNTADLKVKNAILESKEFENAVKEVQAKFMKDGDISPEHIRQALMLLLGKFF